jgi:ribosomal-protein-alanine N-acetyltransferase
MKTAAALRPFRWWDIPAVRNIEEELFPEDPWSVEMFWSELAGVPESRYYVVADEPDPARAEPGKPVPHRIVGYAGLMTQPADHPGATEGWVQNIGVALSHQGRGLGTVLLLELLEEAGRRDCAEIWLEVRTDNETAQRLYQRHGFESVGVRRGYYQPGDHDALIMRKVL